MQGQVRGGSEQSDLFKVVQMTAGGWNLIIFNLDNSSNPSHSLILQLCECNLRCCHWDTALPAFPYTMQDMMCPLVGGHGDEQITCLVSQSHKLAQLESRRTYVCKGKQLQAVCPLERPSIRTTPELHASTIQQTLATVRTTEGTHKVLCARRGENYDWERTQNGENLLLLQEYISDSPISPPR